MGKRGTFVITQLHFLLEEHPFLVIHLINILAAHSEEKLVQHAGLSEQMLSDREDWYFHHFALLLCEIEIENDYTLKDECIKEMVDSMIAFLKNSPEQFEHLNECIYLNSLLLLRLSKYYFHFFPSDKLQALQEQYKGTKIEKLYY